MAASLEVIGAGIAVSDARQCYEVFQAVTDYTSAAYWLTPRLPRFHQVHPHLNVSLVTSERGPAGRRGGTSVAILFDGSRFRHGEAYRLFREEMFPICSPRLVEGLQLPLAKVHLMHLSMPHLRPV